MNVVLENNITGRDGYVTLKGLLYGIAAIQGMPKTVRPFSDLRGMCAIARALGAHKHWAILVWEFERLTGREIDLWPDRENMSVEDYQDRDELREVLERLSEGLNRAA